MRFPALKFPDLNKYFPKKTSLAFLSLGIVLGALFMTVFASQQRQQQISQAATITPVYQGTQTGGVTSSTSVSTAADSTGVNGDLYVAVVSSKPDRAVSTVTGLGLTWRLAKAQCSGRAATRTEIWWAQGAATTGRVTATFATAPINAVIAVSRYSSVDSISPVGAVASANTRGVNGVCSGGVDNTSYTTSLTTSAENSLVFGAVSLRNRTHTPGAGYIERVERFQGSSGDVAGVAVEERAVASASTNPVNGTFSGTIDWALVAVEIKGRGTSPTLTPIPTPTTPAITLPPTLSPTPLPTGATPPPTATVTPVAPTATPVVSANEQRLATARADYANEPRINCSAYPNEKRIFLETQAWWMEPTSVKFPSSITSDQQPVSDPAGQNGKVGGHTHTATCFPQGQKIAGGKLHFDVRLMLHKGDYGRVTWLDVGLGPDGTSLSRVNFSTPLTCPETAADITKNCTFWVPIDVDTSKIPSGYQELRFRFNVVQPNGERQFASTGWQAWYHGGTSTYRTPPWIEARGWYIGPEYANARFRSELPMPSAGQKVKGIWTVKVESVPGSGGLPIIQSGVFIDGFFNANDFGKIIRESQGEFRGSVSIDTTQLSNGLHYLAVLSSNRTDKGINTGLLNIPFIVEN